MPGPFLIEVVFSKEEAARLMSQFARLPRTILTMLHRITKDDMNKARIWMIQHKLTGRVPTATSLATRSGRLIKSFRTTVKYTTVGRDKAVEARTFIGEKAGTDRHRPTVYGPVHEYSKVINARNAKYLAIPLRDEARLRPPRRIAGLRYIKFRSKPGSKSEDGWTRLLVKDNQVATKTHTFGAGKLTAGAPRMIAYFVLKKQVKIPDRPFMQPTADMWFPIITDNVSRSMDLLKRDFLQGAP